MQSEWHGFRSDNPIPRYMGFWCPNVMRMRLGLMSAPPTPACELDVRHLPCKRGISAILVEYHKFVRYSSAMLCMGGSETRLLVLKRFSRKYDVPSRPAKMNQLHMRGACLHLWYVANNGPGDPRGSGLHEGCLRCFPCF